MTNQKQIKVSASTTVSALSGSIIKSIEEGFDVEVRAVGAGAVNQMYKAITSARGIIATKGKDLYIKPGFDTIVEDGNERTVALANIIVK